MTDVAIGIDFGTTNCSIACADPVSGVALASFPFAGGMTDAYRSLLYLEQIKEQNKVFIKSWTGPQGIERYLEAEHKGRLIQSMKSFLTSHSLQTTDVFGRRRTLEELIAAILGDLRKEAERQFRTTVRSAVVGRPVHFVGSQSEEDDKYAQERLEKAFHLAGFESVNFEMEPVAAAHYYESTLDHDELILIGDFGGGTSDFSLVRVGPGVRRRGRSPKDLLGNAGIGLAGDSFDAKLIRHIVSPALGAGSQISSMNKLLPVPNWVYFKLERWHHLSFLRTKEVMNMLRSVKTQALEPEKIGALIDLIQEDLGYQLHRAIQKTKYDLSNQETARFVFADGGVNLNSVVHRRDFELWIAEELTQMETCVESLLKACGVDARDVDMVFLTGGTSFVPAVRQIFDTRFGAERIRTGHEFTSVAMGLALKAARDQVRATKPRGL
ncbi:MAG: Hsp70 family protein [Bryobacteraceae bacterium]